MNTPFLEVAAVRKSYARHPALAGVSLNVERGELFGLLGPNGAGKTTLLSIISGLLDADSGEVRLDGRVFRRADRDLRRLVGIGTQDLSVYPELTARENLVFFGKLYGMRGDTLAKRVEELLTAVSLADRGHDRAGTFSGGMKRRLNLAVAVVHGPQLLLLDEPTTGVDPQSRHHIYELVKLLNAGGMTIIYTSHYMEEVQALCPRIAILDGGHVKACERLPDLLAMLDASLWITVDHDSPGFSAELAHLQGVKMVSAVGGGYTLTADTVAPLLPKVAEVCRAHGVTPRAMTATEPTLERVFLHLTGRDLRD